MFALVKQPELEINTGLQGTILRLNIDLMSKLGPCGLVG